MTASVARSGIAAFLISAGGVALATSALAQAGPTPEAPSPDTKPGDTLREGFRDPGREAQPRVWWHWMNGNVTWEGAKADMDWMKRIGMAGLQAFEAE